MTNLKKNFSFMLLLMFLFVLVIGCEENSRGVDRRANGCRQEQAVDADADTDTNTASTSASDSDYSKLEGNYKLVGVTFIMGGNPIDAGSHFGQLGVDWYGDVAVTAEGHVEGEFTLPPMAAEMDGPFTYDIIEFTEDSIHVSSSECEKGSDWVKYSVEGEEISATFELAKFCKATPSGRAGETVLHFVKSTGDDDGSYPDAYSGGGGGGTMGLTVQSPVEVTTSCMIDTLINFH